MPKTILLFAAATCLAGAAPAFAQDTEQAPAKAFAGPRVEATIGLDQSGDDALPGFSELTGLRVGGAAGYDVAIGKRVTIGVEGGIGWVVAGSANTGSLPPSATTYKIDAARDIDVSARIGYALSPKTLVYAKAGWADLRYDIHGSDGLNYGPSKFDGPRVGAGIEQKITSNVYAKAEYRYTRYDQNFGHTDRHQLLTGLGVRF
jgi:outer membrane immunogenic protein